MKGEAYKEASHVLRPEELEFLSQWAVNPTIGCARAMSMMVSELQLDPQRQVMYCTVVLGAWASSWRPIITMSMKLIELFVLA